MLVTVLKSRFVTAGVAVVLPPGTVSEIGNPAPLVPTTVKLIAVSLPPEYRTTRRCVSSVATPPEAKVPLMVIAAVPGDWDAAIAVLLDTATDWMKIFGSMRSLS
jgi:hypothetical protein